MNEVEQQIAIVVNDDPTQLKVLAAMTQKAGLHPLPFTSVESALAAMSTGNPPALIITDVHMPNIDGWKFCRLLKSADYEPFNRIPILVISAIFAGEAPDRIAAEIGADAFLASPVDGHRFVRQVKAILRGDRKRHHLSALIIEDSPTLSHLLQNAFVSEGYRADVAHSLQEVADIYTGVPYDVAIIDYHLPDGLGDTLLERFHTERPDCACIMMTGDLEPELSVNWMKRGAAAYVHKPFNSEYLLELCAKARRERSLLRTEDLLQLRTRELQSSERNFQSFYDTIADIAVVTSLDARILYANPTAVSTLGYSLPEMASMRLLDWAPPECRAEMEEALAAAVREKQHRINLSLLAKGGSLIPTESRFWLGQWGGADCIFGICRDRSAENEAQRQFEQVFNFNPSPMALLDFSDRHFTEVNQAFLSVTGFQKNEVIGQTVNQLGLFANQEQLDIIRKRLVTEKSILNEEIRVRRKNGDLLDGLFFGEVISIHGRAHLLTVIVDITERKRAAAALDQRMMALLQPIDSPEGIEIGDLFNLDELQQLQDEFSAATGVASVITDTRGIPITKPSRFTRLCNLIRQTHAGCANCFHSDSVIGRHCISGPTVQPCLSGGLWDAGAGIAVGGKHIANWLIGQVRDATQSEEQIRAYARSIGAREDEIASAFFEVPAMTKAQFENVSQMLFSFANQLSKYAYQTIQQARYISERKRVEEQKAKLEGQLVQAQKMESIGRLAGGVAHDFNNMLSVILGHAELALKSVSKQQPLHEELEEIRNAAERSVDLTRQLLAFARKQKSTPTVLDMNKTVDSMMKMLRRLLGEHIDLVWQPGSPLGSIQMDPSQLDQIMVNLCVNARDAVGEKGQITIQTSSVVFDKTTCAQHAGANPGPYVHLAVSDTGCGMDADTLAQIFEPFFTTKGLGQGTGLGLATVYGIVKQNQGLIEVDSEPNRGTTFHIYLPQIMDRPDLHTNEIANASTKPCQETILLVEDEPAILRMGKLILERQGYTVLPAGTPLLAVQLAKDYPHPIHLLITDVIMPDMNGRDLAKKILETHPCLKILFMSGHTAEILSEDGSTNHNVHFLQKPFTIQSLLATTSSALRSSA